MVVVLAMTVSLAIVRFVAHLNGASGDNFLGRVNEARAALPRIAQEPDDLVMVFGSSMVQAGFSARQFDRELTQLGVDIKSFNFGFGGLNPYFQDVLARRIRESFESDDRRLKLAVLEFNPFQTTQARWQGALPVIDSFLGLLSTPEELWEMTLEDPARGLRMVNIRCLRDGVSAEMITYFFGTSLRPERPRTSLPEDPEESARLQELGERLTELFETEYPDYKGEDWSYDWQGAGTIPEERSEETLAVFVDYYEAMRTDVRLDDDRLSRVASADIEQLRFEEELVAGYVRLVREFQLFSDAVEVILLPRNTDWIRYSPEARQRLDDVIERIERETGVVVRNYQELEGITPDMFSDTTHLARYSGDVAFTHFLAQEFGPLLGP